MTDIGFYLVQQKAQDESATLYRDRQHGGFTVPNLFKYYKACHLLRLLNVYNTKYQPIWISLFETDIAPYTIETLLWQNPLEELLSYRETHFCLQLWYIEMLSEFSHSLSFRGSPPFFFFFNQEWFQVGFNNETPYDKHLMKHPMTNFETIMTRAMDSIKHLIALLYKFLITPRDSDLTTYQKKWELLLNAHLNQYFWENIWCTPEFDLIFL